MTSDAPRRRTPAPAPYARVKQQLRDRLIAGDWAPGDQMPSEADLVAEHGVSRMTVNRALKELQAEGLVDRVQGVGTFAARLNPVSARLTLRDLHEEIVGRGHQHRAEVHRMQREAASPALARQLDLADGAEVFHSIVVHFENNVPLQCEDRYVNPLCAPGYIDADLTTTTATHYLFEHTALWQADYAIEACLPTTDEAALLRIPTTEPCLVMVRRTATRERPITLARLVHPSSRYRLEGRFSP